MEDVAIVFSVLQLRIMIPPSKAGPCYVYSPYLRTKYSQAPGVDAGKRGVMVLGMSTWMSSAAADEPLALGAERRPRPVSGGDRTCSCW